MSYKRFKGFIFLIVSVLLCGCDILSGPPRKHISAPERIAEFKTIPTHPLLESTKIYWNKHAVPYVVSEYDNNAAFALGMVQAHLRLGQMELAKRIAQGRVSESLGVYFNDIDHTLRIMDFYQSAPEIFKKMPDFSKEWLISYVAGINHYKKHTSRKPYDFDIFNLKNEDWTPEDSIALGKLGGTDLHWIVMAKILPYVSGRYEGKILDIEKKLHENIAHQNLAIMASSQDADKEPLKNSNQIKVFSDLLSVQNKSGSNAYAISGHKSATHAPIVASDPHLGIFLPNFWMIAGVYSPSYKVVGMMAPGTPLFAFGRTPSLSWGGTNLRAAQTDLVDISEQFDKQFIIQKTTTIKTRWWWDTTRIVRHSAAGVIISDSPLFPELKEKTVALKWLGHQYSDEITAMLNVYRAENAQGFVKALTRFALPAQNMVYADKDGNIGNVLAAFLPNRPQEYPKELMISYDQMRVRYAKIYDATTLPQVKNPSKGFVVSANNLVYKDKDDYPLLSWYTTSDERYQRLSMLLSDDKKLTLDDFRNFQKDVLSLSSLRLRDILLKYIDKFSTTNFSDAEAVIMTLREWDGTYHASSRGALLIEGFLDGILKPLAQHTKQNARFEYLDQDSRLVSVVAETLDQLPEIQAKLIIIKGLNRARQLGETYATWGDVHRMKIGHLVSNIPVISSDYVVADYPAAGNRETLMKTSSERTPHSHKVNYGSQARHLSDMSDIDHNYFVLLGGQDGVFGSETYDDQIELWRIGRYIQMPLSLKKIYKDFPICTEFALTNNKLIHHKIILNQTEYGYD